MIENIFIKVIILISLVACKSYSQNFNSKDWLLFERENITYHTISKSETFSIDDYTFEIIWGNKVSYTEKLGYYGGISSIKIYKNKALINTFSNIEDTVALGEIHLTFYDYNFDGHLDFTLPIDCGKSCWYKYYLYNPKTNKFQHSKDWDYLRIQKINKEMKLILSQPDGAATESQQKVYQIDEFKLFELIN